MEPLLSRGSSRSLFRFVVARRSNHHGSRVNRKQRHCSASGSRRSAEVRMLRVEFLFVAGWRLNSAPRLEKTDVDWARETVKLRAAVSKNKTPMDLSFAKFPSMKEILLRRRDKLRPESVYISTAMAAGLKTSGLSGQRPPPRQNSPDFLFTICAGRALSTCRVRVLLRPLPANT